MARSSLTSLFGGSRSRRGPHRNTNLWMAPVVGSLLAILTASAALTVDAFVDWQDAPLPIFVGSADSARTLLSIIGGAVATLLALIFTVIAVVIQLAIGQYTPRALTILLGDRPTHFTIGVFVGTFTYVLVVLLCLRVATDGETVSGMAMTVAFVLAVVTIGTFAIYSNHIIHSVRATSLINRIATETRDTVEILYPPFGDEPEPDRPATAPAGKSGQVIEAPKPGALVDVDREELLSLAVNADCVLVFVPPAGAFVPEGAPLLEVHGNPVEPRRALDAIELSTERDLRLDAAFGVRQLMDIAARALSAGINDPATALQVLDELHDVLRRITCRQLSDGGARDAQGRVRVVLEIVDRDEMIALTLDEMRRLGAGNMAVTRRLKAVIEDLLTVAPSFGRPSLHRQLELLEEGVESHFGTKFERDLGRTADLRGLGF